MLSHQKKWLLRLRRVAALIAAAFVWLCTAGTLRHSDTCPCCAPIISGSAVDASSSAAHLHRDSCANESRSAACAACQWTQLSRELPPDHSLSLATAAWTHAASAPALPAYPTLRAARCVSLRAPPVAGLS